MLRFAFKPRHPVTKVAFTADGRELVTAQPFVGITVRDSLTGELRDFFPDSKVATYFALMVHPEFGWIAAHTDRRSVLIDTNKSATVPPGTDPDTTRGNPPLNMTDSFRGRWGNAGLEYPRIARNSFRPVNDSNLGIGNEVATAVTRVALHVRFRGMPYLGACMIGHSIGTLDSTVRARHFTPFRVVIAFSPDGRRIALGDGEEIRVFDFSTHEPVAHDSRSRGPLIRPLLTLERPDPSAHGTFADKQAEYWLPPVAFDHAGRTMFTLGLRNRVQQIDLATGGVIAEWGWRCEPIRSLAVAPDDLTAAAGCQRGEVVLWDLE